MQGASLIAGKRVATICRTDVRQCDRRGRYNGAYFTANAFTVFRRRDQAIVGTVIRVNDVPAIVIGVMPEVMKFPDADIWMTVSSRAL